MLNPDDNIQTNHRHLIMVGIGASAGGISALREFFGRMPSDTGMAFVVIPHLSEDPESNLAEILQSQTAMPVSQLNETVRVEPNHVYVIPEPSQPSRLRCCRPSSRARPEPTRCGSG
ncbi:MAG: hypothetical protein IVW51_12495 [Thermaceae bacterium]|nr:hypothetical protein [Thermaceae bacterium]